MTDQDLAPFVSTFADLRAVFALRADATELQRIQAMYFRVLRRFPLHSVQTGAAIWLRSGGRFPKPSDWIKAIPQHETIELPAMRPDEATEHARAVELHYQDDPCRCVLCKAAGVDHKFLRFVPDVDEHDRDYRMKIGDKIVTRGHWAHGAELAAFYTARDQYLALKHVYGPKAMRELSAGDPRVDRAKRSTDPRTLADILIDKQKAKVAALEAHPPADEPLEEPPDVDTSDLFDEPFEEAV